MSPRHSPNTLSEAVREMLPRNTIFREKVYSREAVIQMIRWTAKATALKILPPFPDKETQALLDEWMGDLK